MLAFLRRFSTPDEGDDRPGMTLFPTPDSDKIPALQKTDDSLEVVSNLDKMKNLCEGYQLRLEEVEKTATFFERREKQHKQEALSFEEEAKKSWKEVRHLKEQTRKSRDEAIRTIDEAARWKKALALAEEKIRRQDELLKESRKMADLALLENKNLVSQVSKLQKWTECIDDDEARQAMRELYQALEGWIKRHFAYLLPKADTDGGIEMSDTSLGSRLCGLHELHGEVYALIFRAILGRFLVGCWDDQIGDLFRRLDQEIFVRYPSHVWHHWSSATSSAAFSLANAELRYTCDQVLRAIEDRYGVQSETDISLRTQEMQSLLWRFVEFKNTLERQTERYFFYWLSPNMPLNLEHMDSLTGDYPANSVVEFSLSPVLYKSSSLNEEHTIVQKAVVKLTGRAYTNEVKA